MIERKFVGEKIKELQVMEFIAEEIGRDKYSHVEIKKTPLGEKVIIYTSKPGLVVGKKGETIKTLTTVLRTRFGMENPQVEVAEVQVPELDAQTMADYIVGALEKFGSNRFKSIGYKALQRIIDAGAMGAEIVISGRGVPSSRAKKWRFYDGYLKKSGNVSETLVNRAMAFANLRSGTVGIKVSIMQPNTPLPDRITLTEAPVTEQKEEIKIEVIEEKKEAPKAKKERKPKEAKEKKAPSRKKKEATKESQ